MRKAIIVIFFTLLVSIASAAENESAENFGNASDLPVIENFVETVNETQAEISVVENAEEFNTQETVSITDASTNPGTSESGKRSATASFGVYLEIVG